jgi:putative DNA primase/helicase
MAFLGEAVRKGMSDEVMTSACRDENYKGNAIYEHCAENVERQGEQYLANQIAKARKNSKPNAAGSTEGEIVLVKATDVIARPVDWLWPEHLARCEQQIMTGNPDLGKSLIQCDMVAHATTGKDWPDGSKGCQPGNVIMLTAEDTLETTVKPRLIASGADLSRVFFLDCIKIGDKMQYFLLGEHLEHLQRTINEVSKNSGPVMLVTIDPITAFQGKINSSSPTDVRGQLGPLKVLADHTRVAISTVTHPPKRTSEHWLGQFIGSQSYAAAARIAHACITETLWDEDGTKKPVLKDQQRVFFVSTKGNLWGRTPRTLVYRRQEATIANGIKTARIAWEPNAIDFTIEDALAAAKAPPRTARIDNWLHQQLANGPLAQSDIVQAATAAGHSEAQLRYAKDRLHIETNKDGLQGGWYWTLPENDGGDRHWQQQKR